MDRYEQAISSKLASRISCVTFWRTCFPATEPIFISRMQLRRLVESMYTVPISLGTHLITPSPCKQLFLSESDGQFFFTSHCLIVSLVQCIDLGCRLKRDPALPLVPPEVLKFSPYSSGLLAIHVRNECSFGKVGWCFICLSILQISYPRRPEIHFRTPCHSLLSRGHIISK